jgi:hypothetical protein
MQSNEMLLLEVLLVYGGFIVGLVLVVRALIHRCTLRQWFLILLYWAVVVWVYLQVKARFEEINQFFND